MLKPRIISEVSVRYRARSSRFFPAVLGQARPPSIDARRSISVVVLSCSVLQGGAPRINSEVSAEVSARYTRYRIRSSQFFLAVFTAGTPAVRRVFGLGRCVFHSQGPREEPPAKQSFPRSVSAPVPDRPGSFRLCWAGHARRSVLVVVLLCAILKGGAPRKSIPRSVSATVPDRPGSFRHVPFLRVLKGGAPGKSISRSVSATLPGRPGSFPLCRGGHAHCSVLVIVLACSVLKGGAPRIVSEVSARYTRYRTRSSRFFPAVLGRARPPFGLGRCVAVFRSQGRSPPRINSEVSVRYRTGSSRFFPAVRCDVEVRLCALLRLFGVRFAPRRPLSCTTSFGRDECR